MHGHRPCLVMLTTFYHMCYLLYSATGDVVKVVYSRCIQAVLCTSERIGNRHLAMSLN